MISDLRNKKPEIKLDNGKPYLIVPSGSDFKVWVNTLYNHIEYGFTLKSNLTLTTKVSDYEYIINASSTGFQTVSIEVSNRDKSINLLSNSLLIIVI